MPKMKTRKGASKRFRLTGTGKIRRNHAYCGHILTKKSSVRKRKLRQRDTVEQVDTPRIRKMLGV